ncbi:MAG TPA: Hsp20 family protein [Dongiaceae bacterium]|nr:Hsp20 family protein [Dongiaceae bacterium]
MANVAIRKVERPDISRLPIFEEIEKGLNAVRHSAFEIFEKRGSEMGHALEDWLLAERYVFGWPAAESAEMDSKYEVELTLPGYEAKEVEVTATPSEIIVHASCKTEKEGARKVVWSEFGSNEVYRQFEMPQLIDANKVQASLDKGMLHIIAAKAQVAKAKPMAVAAA